MIGSSGQVRFCLERDSFWQTVNSVVEQSGINEKNYEGKECETKALILQKREPTEDTSVDNWGARLQDVLLCKRDYMVSSALTEEDLDLSDKLWAWKAPKDQNQDILVLASDAFRLGWVNIETDGFVSRVPAHVYGLSWQVVRNSDTMAS